MRPVARKAVVFAHVTSSAGWVGAVVAFLPLAVVAVTGRNNLEIRAALLSMAWLVKIVIVPLALSSVATGVVASLGTPWGLFRHYWVVVKLVLTVLCVLVLAVQVGPIEALAELAADPATSVADLPDAGRPLIHAGGGLAVLLLIQLLGVFKPMGLTRYGWRKLKE